MSVALLERQKLPAPTLQENFCQQSEELQAKDIVKPGTVEVKKTKYGRIRIVSNHDFL